MSIVAFYRTEKPPFSLVFSGSLESALSQEFINEDLYNYLRDPPPGIRGQAGEEHEPITSVEIFDGSTKESRISQKLPLKP